MNTHMHTYTHSINGKAVHDLIAKDKVRLPSSMAKWHKLAVPYLVFTDKKHLRHDSLTFLYRRLLSVLSWRKTRCALFSSR
jgi:hypothetical protein